MNYSEIKEFLQYFTLFDKYKAVHVIFCLIKNKIVGKIFSYKIVTFL